MAPAEENGENPVMIAQEVMTENSTVGLTPVCAAKPGTMGYSVGMTTPSVLEKKLMIPAQTPVA
ncbi:hypothetical protein D3C81_1748840 [compost metagenome]